MAVVGAGLSGLTAAVDLARKGYQLVVFEAGARPGGRACAFPEQALSRKAIDADFEVLGHLGVEVRYGSPVGNAEGSRVRFNSLVAEYDAVYLGPGPGRGQPVPVRNEDGRGFAGFRRLSPLSLHRRPGVRLGSEGTLNDESDVCPRCRARTGEDPRYQCVRCFSVYCRQCPESRGGQLCPKCGMPQRIVLRADSRRGPG